MSKPTLKVEKSAEQIRREQRQAKLVAIADKKKQGKLTIEDLDAKLDVILEQQEEILKKLSP
jgi:hypothetical protein